MLHVFTVNEAEKTMLLYVTLNVTETLINEK